MSALPLPDWYILKEPEDMEIDVEEWAEYAESRLNKFLEGDLWIISRSALISDNDWHKTVIEDVGGHFYLRLAVAKDPRLTSWLVEIEGDLFEFRFVESIYFQDKINVLKDLFGDENVKNVSEIGEERGEDIYRKFGLIEVKRKSRRKTYKSSKSSKSKGVDLEKYVAIRYHKIPNIIGAKRALLYKGWAIVRVADIRLSVKRAFEKELKTLIQKSKMFLDNDNILDNTVKPLRDKITDIARHEKIRGLSPIDSFEGDSVYAKTDVFPPCILELVSILQSKGHLAHAENWQLGTFLKKAGMSREEQLQFWYVSSVDNVGQSFEEFESKVSYQIKHIYGEVGGGTDYEPPKCRTCIEGYFCYFAHKKLEDIVEDIKIKFEKEKSSHVEKAIDDISRLIVQQKHQEACARYFTLHTKGWRMWKNRTLHMLQYAEQAYKRFYSKKDQDKPTEEVKNDKKTDKRSN